MVMVSASSERLRHLYQMARLIWLLVRREGKRSAFNVAETAVIPRQFAAQIHNGEVHELAACSATVFLGCSDQPRSQASALRRRIDREQSEISALAAQFDINAAS
jgi:hypothetical protein